jgi:hypothetical protein
VPQIDEKQRRRPDFRGGVPVRMADGQDWTLPRPRVRFVPDDGPEGFRVYLTGPGDDYADLLAATDAPPDVGGMIRADMALARRLVTTNYDLTGDELVAIVQLGYDSENDPDGLAIRLAILDVAHGRDPKARAGGGA